MNRKSRALSVAAASCILLMAAAPSGKQATDEAAPTVSAPTEAAVTDATSPLIIDDPIETPEFSSSPAFLQAASGGGSYEINWQSINGGGTVNSMSTNYRMGASIGQSVAGAAASTNYQMGIGFWYGSGGGAGCACNCHGDPVCDGVRSDILDVIATVNEAFRGFPAVADGNPACPYVRTDVDCSGAPDVIDVVRTVNVAFRGANVVTEFCNPCA